MGVMFLMGIISFCLVGSMWIISSLLHRPIIANRNIKSSQDSDHQKASDDEKQAAITAATWTVLHTQS